MLNSIIIVPVKELEVSVGTRADLWSLLYLLDLCSHVLIMNLFRPLSRNSLLRSTCAPYSTKGAQAVRSFTLLDGTSIPWIAWGNGTGSAQQNAVAIECGRLALDSGIRHIDTAQIYFNEKETGEAIQRSSLSRDDIYVTSKCESSKAMIQRLPST